MAKPPDDRRLELLQGTLDMLVLRSLQWGPRHGHGIGQAIRAQSDEILKVETGSLYPALHRLVQRGWLKSEWGISEANQRAKYYRLTATGKAQLVREQDRSRSTSHRRRPAPAARRRTPSSRKPPGGSPSCRGRRVSRPEWLCPGATPAPA